MKKRYILFIDSGVGGLSTLAETIKILPTNFIYLADNKFMPYGSRSETEIFNNLKNLIISIQKKYKLLLVVLACNTATTSAIKSLRSEFKKIKFVGTEPAVKLAEKSGAKRVLCVATPTTAKAARFAKLAESFNGELFVSKNACLASQIERYLLFPCLKNRIILLKSAFILVAASKNFDAVILGCTHYVFLKKFIEKNSKLPVFDGNFGVAKQISKLVNKKTQKSSIIFIFSKREAGLKQKYRKILDQILANQKKLC